MMDGDARRLHATLSGSPMAAARADARRTADPLLCAMLAIYIASMLFEGVLRWSFALAGLPNALYLRDAIPALSIAFILLRALCTQDRVDLAIVVPAAVLVAHGAWALLLGIPPFAIAIGLKLFLPLLYGIAMWSVLRSRTARVLDACALMFAVTVAGMLANFAIGQFPWEGLQYDTAFGQASTTRLWWDATGSRLPGFTRTSFDAAMVLGVTGILTLVRFRRWDAQLLVVCAALAGIVFTTSKGMLLAFPLAAVVVVVMQRRPRVHVGRLVLGVAIVGLVLPVTIAVGDVCGSLSADSVPTVLLSLWDRCSYTWPRALRLLPDGPLALLGAGLGGIGTPQLYGLAPHLLNPGDSLALYLLIAFGLAGACYYLLPALAFRRVARDAPRPVPEAYVGLMLIAYIYGMSISMIEDGFFALAFGICCGIAASVAATRIPVAPNSTATR